MRASPKPSLPAGFTSPSDWRGAYGLLHGLFVWFGSAGVAWWLWQQSGWPTALRVAAMLPCMGVAGLGMFYLGSLGHEGFHGNLNRNRHVSMVLGIVGSLGAPLFLSVGVNSYHWRHHRHTNTRADPDWNLYRGNRSLLDRARGTFATTRYAGACLFALLRRDPTVLRGLPFSPLQMQGYAALNLALVVASTCAYVATAFVDIVLGVCFVAGPALAAQAYWTLHPYIEHGGTDERIGSNARNTTSPFLRVVMRGYTYHLCHHLYPGVPSYRLPALERHLRTSGFLTADSPRESSFLGALRVGLTRALP